MPASRVCPCTSCEAHTGKCPTLTAGGRCPRCTTEQRRAAEADRPSTTDRGYGTDHQRERRRWARIVAKGGVRCARCPRLIDPNEPWHLDHNDDRTGYLGPSHADCNDRAAARKRNRPRGIPLPPTAR